MFDSRNGHRPILQRLAQHLQHVARELGQLVEKQHAVVRQADFARPRHAGAAADQAGVGDGVVRRAERPLVQQSRAGRQQSPRCCGSWWSRSPLQTSAAAECRPAASPASSLPDPGGPIISTLWPPAAATSSARLAIACPRTSRKSGRAGTPRRAPFARSAPRAELLRAASAAPPPPPDAARRTP